MKLFSAVSTMKIFHFTRKLYINQSNHLLSLFAILASMKITMKPVASPGAIETVARLAEEIWNEHYVPIIGQEQVDYMVAKYQSAQAISNQIENESYIYFLIFAEAKVVGYVGMQIREQELFLSKYYVHRSQRGKGYGKQALDFIRQYARERGLKGISLTVNKFNSNSIAAYEKMGFLNLGPTVADIGNGFIMDDYKMRLPLN
jgi:RimJ/RimL family protein N-acetyltransferase